MLMEKSHMDIDQDMAAPGTAPVTAGPVYVAGKTEIRVPVYAIPPAGVFAPPFLIPKGEWTVVFEAQDRELVFSEVSYKNPTKGTKIKNDGAPGQTTWTTTFDTSEVTDVNKLHCEIKLMPLHSNGRPAYSGDPTIAVTQDPMT